MSRLVRLSSLNVDAYAEETSAVELRSDSIRLHRERVFHEWLTLSLRQQRADLASCLRVKSAGTFDWLSPELYSSVPPPSATEAECLLFFCDLKANLAVLRNEFTNDGPPDWRVQCVIGCVDRRAADVRLSLKELSLDVNLSADRLGRVFLKRTGMPFRRLLRLMRVGCGAHALLNGRLSVLDVALSLGFMDPSNFVHEFQEVLKVTPGALRAQLLGGGTPNTWG